MFLKINPLNPESKKIKVVAEYLQKGGLIIYPTDTIYALGCDIQSKVALEQLARIKEKDLEESNFSIVCNSFSEMSNYSKNFDSATFKFMKNALPGPYTFILNANKDITKLFGYNKKTIGIRMMNNAIARAIVEELGRPIATTSIHHHDEVLAYMTDPKAIYERFKGRVDIVIDGGPGDNEGSTVVDFTGKEPELIRSGRGMLN